MTKSNNLINLFFKFKEEVRIADSMRKPKIYY